MTKIFWSTMFWWGLIDIGSTAFMVCGFVSTGVVLLKPEHILCPNMFTYPSQSFHDRTQTHRLSIRHCHRNLLQFSQFLDNLGQHMWCVLSRIWNDNYNQIISKRKHLNIFICKCILTKLTKVTNLLRGLKNWHNKLHKCPCKHKDLFYYFVRFYKFMYLLLFLVLASYWSTQHCIRLTEKHSNYIYEFHKQM